MSSLILCYLLPRKLPWSSQKACKGWNRRSVIVSSVSVWSLSNEPGNSCSHALFWIIDVMGRCFHHSSSCRFQRHPDWIGWREERKRIITVQWNSQSRIHVISPTSVVTRGVNVHFIRTRMTSLWEDMMSEINLKLQQAYNCFVSSVWIVRKEDLTTWVRKMKPAQNATPTFIIFIGFSFDRACFKYSWTSILCLGLICLPRLFSTS